MPVVVVPKECYREILFSDDKIFALKETFNKQNDRVYIESSKEACKLVPRIELGHYPVWWGVSYDGITS